MAVYFNISIPLILWTCVGRHGCHSPTAHIWTHSSTMGTTKEGKIYLFQDSFTGIFRCPFFHVAPEWWECARGCCVFQHEPPSSAGPEKGSGLVLGPSWKEGVVPLGGTCVAQNLQMGKNTAVKPTVPVTMFQTTQSFQDHNGLR